MNNQLGLLMGGFIVLIMGLTLIPAVADQVTSATEIKTTTNESITFGSGGPVVQLAQNQLVAFTSITNTTVTVLSGNYSVDLSAGKVTPTASTGLPNGTYDATYTYREVGNSTSRTLISLVVLFFAISIMAFAVGMAVQGMKEYM